METFASSRDLWDNLPGILAIVFIFGGSMIVGAIALITSAWKSNRQNDRVAVLKQQMLDRGMSAEEIVRVIDAGVTNE